MAWAASLLPDAAWLWPALSSALVNCVILVAVFVPLEQLLPARVMRVFRDQWATDLAFFMGQYLLFGAVASALLVAVRRALEGCAIVPAAAGLQTSLMVALGAVIAGDVLVYWFHRACHQSEFLWRFHRVHHSSTSLDWLAAHREHPVDGWLTQLFQNAPALVLGVRIEYLAGLVLFRNAWAIFIHSNVRVDVGPLRYLVGAPELHRYHHAKVAQTRHNFANLAPWLDVVFGTYCRPEPDATYELGVPEVTAQGYLPQLAEPFHPAPLRAAR